MAQHMGWGLMEEGWRKGPWTTEEDRLLGEYVKLHGEGKWNNVARLAGLKRNGKSCRLRWVNYLRPDLKRGHITPYEESIILELHARWGNRWSTIARSLPGRTDNEIKNYWRTHFTKKTQNPEKSRARLLWSQQFQQQQQQQQRQRQQNQIDIKKIISLFDENDNKSQTFTQLRHEMVHPNAPHEQEFLLPETSNDMIIWDGLWNLDDLIHGNIINRANYQQTLAAHFY